MMFEVTSFEEIIAFGVIEISALAVDGELKVSGKVASPEEIKEMLK